jgi:hypothetical protein
VSHGQGKKLFSTGRALMAEKDKIIEMLAKVDDHFGLKIYKKVYHVTDKEIEDKRRTLKPHGEHK